MENWHFSQYCCSQIFLIICFSPIQFGGSDINDYNSSKIYICYNFGWIVPPLFIKVLEVEFRVEVVRKIVWLILPVRARQISGRQIPNLKIQALIERAFSVRPKNMVTCFKFDNSLSLHKLLKMLTWNDLAEILR